MSEATTISTRNDGAVDPAGGEERAYQAGVRFFLGPLLELLDCVVPKIPY